MPILAVLLCLAFARLAAAQTDAGTVPVTGVYTNVEYGFRLALPPGLAAEMNAPPAPNHGVRIVLGPGRAIEITAEFDAALLGSARAYLDAELSDNHATAIVRATGMLGGHPAETASATGNERPEVFIVQRRAGAGGIFYSVNLVTDGAHFERDKRTLNAVLSTFRELRLPS